MNRVPLSAFLIGAAVSAAGYLTHSGLLAFGGALFALGVPAGWASWRAAVAKSRIITGLDDERERKGHE